jgi:hypothetical protein
MRLKFGRNFVEIPVLAIIACMEQIRHQKNE